MHSSSASLFARAVACAAVVLSASGQAFEVASVKPTTPGEPVIAMLTYPGGRIIVTNYTLKMLIHEAYEIDDQFIQGGPGWTSQVRYSISAQPPADSPSSKINPSNPKLTPPAEELAMLRTLLAERFHLKIREEIREGQVYSLTVSSSGHKLKPPKDPNTFAYIGTGGFSTRPGLIRSANATMALLARGLTRLAGRPVIDRTGLEGAYDFEFEFARGLSESPLPSLPAALQELGLRLTPEKGPVRYIVIDQAEQPGEN
ncbi:MAG: TIGR03435 family protein [Acidobacteriota bacterium]